MNYDRKTNVYMATAYLGTAGIVLYIGAVVLQWPDFVRGVSVGILLVSLALLLRRKLRDEYMESLWSAGTAVAFIVLVAMFLFAPWLEGFFDGLTGLDGTRDTPVELAPALAILGFFVGFHARRWRGY